MQWHASSRKPLQMAARAATVRAAVARAAVALKALLCCPRCAPLPKLPLVAEMPRRMVPSGDAKTSMRDARNARLHRGCCTAHHPDEALHADDVMCAAGEANLYQEREDCAKMTGSRMAFVSRGQAPCAHTQNHSRGQRGPRSVRELGSGWRARSLTVENGVVTD